MAYEISVNPSKTVKPVSKYIYGHFTEHLGRCIYGGIYEEGSPLSDHRGFRKDVLEAIKKIKVPILRWPGGNFVSNYHWEDGIGPKDQRPVRFDLAWQQEETNRFGTDEFIEYCREIKAEPYICVNLGTGTLDEALHWLEYCNGKGNTYYAQLRRKYGHPEPYNVKFWGIGNEMYGEWQVGHMTADEYARVAKEYAKWMKVFDPSIKTIAVGCDDHEWNLKVLNQAGDVFDYISYHFYTGSENYYETVSTVYLLEQRLIGLKRLIETSRTKRRNEIKIALDEWNVWYRVMDNKLEEPYDLTDGIFACGVLIMLQRISDIVPIANLAQLVNALGAIHTEKNGIILTPVYKAFELIVNHSGEKLVETIVETETYDIEGKMFYFKTPFKVYDAKLLDATATISEDGKKLYLAVVNYNKDSEIRCPIKIKGCGKKQAKVYVLNGPDIKARNTLEKPNVVDIVEKTTIVDEEFEFTFEPHSCTVIEVERS
ncbi:alpha-N-arabinofuranosidase [Pseudothermotoga thermarum]|uniref:non-reducing end alpha-L-arabinofuranosidase n=1 Tax=Pseudothermotoga thermarum DSM 5069 TaxID=688269 RepID=F7YTI3_9THEM|nr:alpha-N-arabinofuranosidase [Pseudothermotoga thermarum]AEH51197.1 alpha-L-arabinofuranosidase domain protein [Pseudothermotoga thermarum DSM 5069]